MKKDSEIAHIKEEMERQRKITVKEITEVWERMEIVQRHDGKHVSFKHETK